MQPNDEGSSFILLSALWLWFTRKGLRTDSSAESQTLSGGLERPALNWKECFTFSVRPTVPECLFQGAYLISQQYNPFNVLHLESGAGYKDFFLFIEAMAYIYFNLRIQSPVQLSSGTIHHLQLSLNQIRTWPITLLLSVMRGPFPKLFY